MKKEVFEKMLNSGEFEQLFNENKINDLLNEGSLSKEQIDKLVDLGKRMSKDEILRRQRDLSKQPGYKEHVLTPLIKKITAQQGRARDPATGKYIKQEAVQNQNEGEQPEVDTPNPDRTAERAEQMGQKFKPKRMKNMFSGSRGATAKPATSKVNTELYSKIGLVQNPRLLKGDNAATVASKLYSIMKNDINEYNVRNKLERKRDNSYLDNERKRHNEIITALNKAGGGPGGPSRTTTKSGMGLGTKLAVGAGLIGAVGLAAAAEKPVPKVETPPSAPVEPQVNVDNEVRKKQLEAEREAAAQQEKQKREQESQQRESEQKQKEAEQKKAAEDKKKEQEEKKKAEEKQKAAAAEEARKQKEQQEDDKRKAAEAKAKTEREEKERKALADEEKRKKDAAERIAKAQAEGQKREAERLRREEEKTAREEAARIKKEREDAEKEADAQKRESALRLKKQAEAIAAEIERQKSQKDDYQPPRNGPRELPYDESISRRYPKPIVTPSPKEFKFKTGTQVGNYVDVPKRTATPVPAPAPTPAPVTRITGTRIGTTISRQVSEKVGGFESGQMVPVAYNTMNQATNYEGKGKNKTKIPGDEKMPDGNMSNIVEKGNLDISTARWDNNEKKWDYSNAKRFSSNLSEMTIGEVINLQDARNKAFGGSSKGTAAGRYQFIRTTLKNNAALLFGPNYRNEIFSADVQEMLQNENIIEIVTSLSKAKIPITERNIYLAHFNGIPFVIDAMNPENIDKTLSELPSWGKTEKQRAAKTKSNPERAAETVRSYLEVVRKFENIPYKLEDFGDSARKFRMNPGSKRNDELITELQELYGDKRSYKILTEPTLSEYEHITGNPEKNRWDEMIPKKIPKQEKSDNKKKVSIIINNETTMLGSTNRSGLSIPTSPDNNAFYPYTA